MFVPGPLPSVAPSLSPSGRFLTWFFQAPVPRRPSLSRSGRFLTRFFRRATMGSKRRWLLISLYFFFVPSACLVFWFFFLTVLKKIPSCLMHISAGGIRPVAMYVPLRKKININKKLWTVKNSNVCDFSEKNLDNQ